MTEEEEKKLARLDKRLVANVDFEGPIRRTREGGE
jgi:hypothetical protein